MSVSGVRFRFARVHRRLHGQTTDLCTASTPIPQTVLSFSSALSSCTSLHKGKVGGRIMSLVLAGAGEH